MIAVLVINKKGNLVANIKSTTSLSSASYFHSVSITTIPLSIPQSVQLSRTRSSYRCSQKNHTKLIKCDAFYFNTYSSRFGISHLLLPLHSTSRFPITFLPRPLLPPVITPNPSTTHTANLIFRFSFITFIVTTKTGSLPPLRLSPLHALQMTKLPTLIVVTVHFTRLGVEIRPDRCHGVFEGREFTLTEITAPIVVVVRTITMEITTAIATTMTVLV